MLVSGVSSMIVINMRRAMEIFPESVTRLWNEWELRVLVLVSLFLQIVLILLGNRRKYIARNWVSVILWMAYLAADWIAAVCIGILSNSQGEDDSSQANNMIWAFWAPFLLLHLGGPDTITAFSLDDNELWLRHLLGLVIQFGGAFYVFLKCWKGKALNILAIPMFMVGMIRYGERTWALRSASSSQFRESLLHRPGPNYAKIMGKYTLQRSQGFNVSFKPVPEPSTKANCLDPDALILQVGYALFKAFKRLFADLILSFQDREVSQSFFHNTTWEKAFAVIEVELGFMYDVLYTKASMTYCRWGHLLRSMSLSFTVSTFIAFLLINKHEYSTIDLIITFLLLVGAIVLEIYAIIVLLSSDWTALWMSKHKKTLRDGDEMDRANVRWSNSMAQYNLMSFCLKDKPIRWYLGLLQRFSCVCEMIEKHHYESSVIVADNLKALIFQHLSDKSKGIKNEHSDANSNNYKELYAARGDLVLKKEKYNCHSDLGWSVEGDFDQSILLWHVATDVCYYTDQKKNSNSELRESKCEECRVLSDYMLYLLVMRTFMMPHRLGQIRYQDTCKVMQLFKDRKQIMNRDQACEDLLKSSTEIPPLEVKGDKSKSVLFDACRLAESLQSLETQEEWECEKKWEMMSHVWVEMLCYAAKQCRWNHHAKQLRRGGELLTHVWLLMAHLGLTEHFNVSGGY